MSGTEQGNLKGLGPIGEQIADFLRESWCDLRDVHGFSFPCALTYVARDGNFQHLKLTQANGEFRNELIASSDSFMPYPINVFVVDSTGRAARMVLTEKGAVPMGADDEVPSVDAPEKA